VQPRGQQSGGAVDQGFADPARDHHLGDLGPDAVEVQERLAELLALGSVLHGRVDGGLDGAGRGRPELEPSEVQGIQDDLVALADLAEQVLRRHQRVLEDEPAG